MNIQSNTVKQSAHRASHCLKGLANETRLLILMALKNGEMGVLQIAKATGYPQPTVSQHLAKMKERGLLVCHREGTQILYSIADKRMFEFLNLMKELFCK